MAYDRQCKTSHRIEIKVSNELHSYFTPGKEFPVANKLKSGWIITNKVEGKVGPVHALKAYRGSRGRASLILHLGIRRR
jgi:hypothetical protein